MQHGKQIKKNVLYEGAILSIIAIPIGVLAGTGAIWILLKIVNSILVDYLNGLEFNVTLWIPGLIIAAVISLITMFLSVITPAKKTAKISPIEAIRGQKDIVIKSKKLKTSKLFDKLFGIEGQIALKNLKRSRKKYRTTIVSIFVSIVIFISLNSFMENSFKVSKNFYQETLYNLKIRVSDLPLNKEDEKVAKILKLGYISEYSIINGTSVGIDSKYLSQKGKEHYIRYGYSNINLDVYTLGDTAYEKYLNKLGFKKEDYENKAILIDKFVERNADVKGQRFEFNYLNIKPGDTITVTKNPYDSENKENMEVSIGRRTDVLPMGISQDEVNQNATIIVSTSYFEKFANKNVYSKGIYINSNDASKLEKLIKEELPQLKNNIYNQEKDQKEQNSIVLVISIFLYGFITVISLIGITNIFNTITTNVALRRKEFAILRSIGMTDKEFNKMINFESLLYGFKSLIYGIPVGVILAYFINTGFNNIYVSEFVWPIKAIIISIIFVFVIIFTTMRYSIGKIKNQNIIETIRNENI